MRLAAIFTDKMVLQRDRINRIFGTGRPSENIRLEFMGKTYTAVFDDPDTDEKSDGDWYIDIDPAAAGGPYEMMISYDRSGDKQSPSHDEEDSNIRAVKYKKSAKDGTIVISDILIGEVWFAGGQSNMELELQNSENGIEAVHTADHDMIRYYYTPKCPSVDDELLKQENNTCWRYAKGDEAREMSAVAYYFAVKLNNALDVPVGIIDCYWGGTSVTCWIPRSAYEEVISPNEDLLSPVEPGDINILNEYISDWDEVIKTTPDEKYQAELKVYNKQVDEWNQRSESLKKETPDIRMEEINEKAGLYPWPPPRGAKSPFRPFGLYDSMVSRVCPYGIRGFLYYQGEEDVDRAGSYSALNTELINVWRKDFSIQTSDAEYPFFITQLPMFIEKGAKDEKKFTSIRKQQQITADSVHNVGMIINTDCGEFDNIHPVDKKTPGERLAMLVLGRVYEHQGEFESMRALSADFQGQEVCIRCGYTYGEIHIRTTAPEGPFTAKLSDREIVAPERLSSEIYGFELSEDGVNYEWAQAYMKDDHIYVSSYKIKDPVSVRYAWFDYGTANVYNAAGLPLAPFRFDKE